MAFIYNLTDNWTDVNTTWNGIKLAVTNTSSDASSKLLNLTVTGATTASFVVDKNGNLALNGTVNKVTFTAPATGATLTLADGSTFATVGGYATTFTFSGATSLTFPTSGTVTALGNSTTGSGDIVLATSPTLVSPALGTPSSATLTNATGLPVSTGISGLGSGVATWLGTPSSANLAAAVTDETGSGSLVFATSPTLVTPNLGTPSAATLTNATGLPISTGVSGLGSGVATFLGTPSSANLASAVTDETGSGSLVFGTSPTIATPTITGAATFNGSTSGTVALKAPAVAGTTTFQLPAGNGTSGYVLVTDGLGNTSWAASGGAAGNAAGLNKNVQFNDSGSMAGNAAFNFDKATDTLSVGVASTTSGKFALYNSASANAVTVASGNNSAAWTLTLPTSGGTNGYALTTDGSGNTSWSAVSSGLNVGSTSISGGTSGRILYDNAGTLGEKAVTGTGDVVLATSPALVTPDLGTPSSGTLTNATGLPISTGVSGLGTNVATALGNTVNGASGIVALDASSKIPAVDGSQITALNAGNISSGTLAVARGGTGITSLGTGVATALGNAVNGASGIVVEDSSGNTSIAGTAVMGSSFLRNRIINGAMQFDQRNSGASTAVADDVYCFDRWYALTQTASVNVSQQTNQEDGTPFNIRLTQNQASAQRMGLAQIIESVNCVDLRGQSVVLNMRLRCSSSQAIRYAILEWTGTADSVTSDVVNSWTNTTYTAGQFFISTTTTVTAVGSITPSANTWTSLSVPLTGTLGSSFNNITVFVWTEGAAAQNVTLDISRVQLEVGSVATPFERRQYGQELALCQRYLPAFSGNGSSNSYPFFAAASSTTQAYVGVPFMVQARTSPTGLVSSVASGFLLGNGSVNTSCTSIAFSAANPSGGSILATTASGLTAFTPYFFIQSGTSSFYFTGCEL